MANGKNGAANGKGNLAGPINGGDGDDILAPVDPALAVQINGGGGNDDITGSDQGDVINAGDGNDTILGGGGDDTIRGNDGDDTAVYEGSIFDFLISDGQGNSTIVEDTDASDGDEGTDELKHIGTLQFGDYTYVIGQNNAAMILADDQVTTEDDTGALALNFDVDAFDFDGGTVNLDSATITGGLGTVAVVGSADVTQGNYTGTRYTLSYDPGAAYQYLAATESATVEVTLQVSDGQGAISTEVVEILMGGVNDAVIVDAGASDFEGAATEDDSDPLTDGGTIFFGDVDLSDVQTASFAVAGISGSVGSLDAATVAGFLTLSVDAGAAQAGGSVAWAFSADNALFQYLAQGDTVTIAYDVTIDDGNGSTATETVTVTVTGVNDAPTITETWTAGRTEDSADPLVLSENLITFDVDQGDTHSYDAELTSATLSSGDAVDPALLAVLENAMTAVQLAPTNGIVIGVVTATFTLDNDLVQFLGAGDTLTVQYDVSITDNNGGTDATAATIVITGVNDAPTIGSGLVLNLAEDDAATLSAQGGLSTFDVDQGDTHNFGVALNSAVLSSGDPLDPALQAALAAAMTVAGVTPTDGIVTGTVDLDFGLDNALVQFLGVNETLTVTYDVTMTDDSLASDTGQVTVVIAGVNDAPTFGEGDVTGDVTEDLDLLANGSLSASDVDANDVLTWSIQGGGAGQYGTLAVDQNGNWTYTLNNSLQDVQVLDSGASVVDSFTVQVSDGNGGMATQVVDITINGTDDAGGDNPILYDFENGFAASGPGGVVFVGNWETQTPVSNGRADSGYVNGVVSGSSVAFNGFASNVAIQRDDDFDLESVYLTAAWNNGLTFRAIAYNDGVIVGSQDFILNVSGPLFVQFDDSIFDSVDYVEFQSFGGTDATNQDGGSGAHFVMDDLLILG